MSSNAVENVAAEIARPNAYLLVLTGAGISVASGIPTFRGPDPDAVWARDTTQKGTLQYFQRDPVGSWRWYLARFDACKSAKPNAGHHAITEIEKLLTGAGRRCLLVTQNVDGLHADAGAQNLVEIHGAARKMRCSNRKCVDGEPKGVLPWDDDLFVAFRDDPCVNNLPRCGRCRKPLRPHVLWFDERYRSHDDYHSRTLHRGERSFTCVLIVGTSLSVGVTDEVVRVVQKRRLPGFIVDPHMVNIPESAQGFSLVQEPSERFLPSLSQALAALV